MINQQLLDYISKQQEAGTADEIIKENLLQAGWREQDVDEGFQAVSGEDDNSTASHQKMREEAAQKRDGQDEYREDTKQEDEASPETSVGEADNKPASLSAIDDTAVSGSDKEETGSTESGMEEISSVSSSSKLASDSLNNIAKTDTSQVDLDDVGPQPVRTFQSDSKRAGVDIGRQKKAVQIKPAEKGVDKEAASAVEEVAKTEEEREVRRRKAEEEKEQRAKEERQRRKREDEQRAQERRRQQQREQKEQSQPREETGTVNSMADMEESSQETADGRRRFQAAGEPEQVKRRVARQKRQKESSGSNIVSILVFIVALILVGGGAAWAYFTYFQTDTPEATASSVVQALATAQTFDFRTTIETANIDGESNQLIIEGAVDLNPDTPTASYYTISQAEQLATPIQAVVAEVENIGTVPGAQHETIDDILLTPEFFTIGEFQTQERLGQTQDSEGFVTNRFSISMSPRQLVSDYATLHQALFDMPLSGAVLEELQGSVAGFTPTQGQTWIDPDTGVPYQITFIGTNAAGQDVQVNIQFKAHGEPLGSTPPYEPRSFEQTLGQYFSTVASNQDESDAVSTSTEPDNGQADAERRFDRLRINDIQQLVVALRIYANENEMFPSALTALTQSSDAIITTIPQDPVTNESYAYSVAEDGSRYHLGATLELLGRGDVLDDANFNSRGQGFPGGFNGAVSSCGEDEATSTTAASICYDVAGSAE